ncbi:MAG: TIGR02996 domain-containing protein [Kofleriaceae bacterium]
MTTEADLLAAIRADPDDDAPRAIYADWLIERGDPRGTYIQHALHRSSTSHDDEIEAKWQKELGAAWPDSWIAFDRGLPVSVSGYTKSLERLRDVVARFPITTLGVRDRDKFPAFLDLSYIRTLVLQSWSVSRELVDALARAPIAPRALEAKWGAITDDHSEPLAAVPWFRALEKLDIEPRGGLSDTGFGRLFAHPMPELRDLRICGRGLSTSPVLSNVASIVNGSPRLQKLDLSIMKLGPFAAAIASAPLPALVELNLNGTGIDRDVCAALAESRLPIEHFYLNHNELGLDGVRPFGHMTGLPNLKILSLVLGNIDGRTGAEIARELGIRETVEVY